ncbi:MAG: hypothetical protein KGH75_00885 [Rhodospirillales bacterium]|nr:hypothetical protein [Rhodospirillales bacterium]
MPPLRTASALAAVLAFASPAAAASLAGCRAIAAPAARLACYDHIAAPAGARRFTGDGTRTVAPFAMPGPWSLAWHFGSPGSMVTVLDPKGNPVAVVSSSTTAPGHSYVGRGGIFTLDVVASGPWQLRATPLPK